MIKSVAPTSAPGADPKNPAADQRTPPASNSNVEVIPPDAPSFYLDKERKRKVTLIAPTTLTTTEVARIKRWLDLLFFVEEGDGGKDNEVKS